MNKLKTKKILAKKIKITGTGKLLRSHQLRVGHLRRHKSKSTLRKQKKPIQIHKSLEKITRRMLGR